jgi:hypothetical protein
MCQWCDVIFCNSRDYEAKLNGCVVTGFFYDFVEEQSPYRLSCSESVAVKALESIQQSSQ